MPRFVDSGSFAATAFSGSGGAGGLAFGALHFGGEGAPLAERVDVAVRRERVELEEREGVAELFAVDEAELRAAIGGRLEEAPERLEDLFDLVPRAGGEGHAGADRLDQFADEDRHLLDAHLSFPARLSFFVLF